MVRGFSFEHLSASPVTGPLTRLSVSRFDGSEKPIDRMTTHDVEMMKSGFDWARFFLVGHRIVTACKAEEEVSLPASN